MFRNALVRTARRAAVVAPAASRSISVAAASASRPTLAASARKQAVAPAAAWGQVFAVRGYASGGLSKEDVEGRIMSLLAGFDKVSLRLDLAACRCF